MGDMIFNPWTGEWEVLNPSKTPTTTTGTTKKTTGFDWLNAILTGAGNILGGLFPNGLNNGSKTGNTFPTGGYTPTTTQSSTSQNDNTMYLLLGLILVVLLTKK